MISGSSPMRVAVSSPTMDDVPAAAQVTYLSLLDAALVGPRRARRSLLREAADHLEDATDALVEAGLEPDDAARRAVRDFGDVDEVAPAFQETLAVASSRRTAALLLVALGCQPFLWDNGLSLSSSNHLDGPDTWPFAALDLAIELTGGVLLAGAVLAIALTGVGRRWVRHERVVARLTAGLGLGAAVAISGLCVTMTAVSGAPPAFWCLLTVLLLAPMTTVAASARRTWAAA